MLDTLGVWMSLGVGVTLVVTLVAASLAIVLVQWNVRQANIVARNQADIRSTSHQLLAITASQRRRYPTYSAKLQCIQGQIKSLSDSVDDVDAKVALLSGAGDDINGGLVGGSLGTSNNNNTETGGIDDPAGYVIRFAISCEVRVNYSPIVNKILFMYANPNSSTSTKWLFDYIPAMLYSNPTPTATLTVNMVSYTIPTTNHLPNAWYPTYQSGTVVSTNGLATFFVTSTQYTVLPDEVQKIIAQPVTFRLSSITVQIIIATPLILPPYSYLWLVHWTAGF